MIHLSLKEQRCLDDKCPDCQHCLRYLDRRSVDDDMPIASTFRYSTIINGKAISICKHYLKTD